MKVPLPPQSSRLIHGAAGVAATSVLTWMMVSNTDTEDEADERIQAADKMPSFKVYTSSMHSGLSNLSKLLSVPKTSLEPSHPLETQLKQTVTRREKAASSKIVEYDFIVLGHGNAGKSAVQTLKQQCPGATIALVDPLRPVQSDQCNLEYYRQPSLGFHPPTRTVELTDPAITLKYKHAILVATGSRGAPPPMALFDKQVLNRVLELRPTETMGNGKRPVLPPETIRQLALMAAAQGAKVCVLGSGWEAIELAVAAAKTGTEAPMLAFGSAGPLCHVLPRYLSTAVTRRLRQQGVDIQERSLVRYVASSSTKTSRMEVHIAKSFDLMDTQRNLVDLLVVAPLVTGPRGTAVLPTVGVPETLEAHRLGRTWYQSWSQLSSPPSEPSTVVCFADDGRMSVNAELNAASKVYAAGSVAKYPNSVTGHTHVAGEGSVDGALAGRLAAMHMARDYHERTQSALSVQKELIEPASFASESFPIFRSDITPYNPAEGHQSSLSKVGINALVLGCCDSEKMSTHGFWWTNISEKRHTVGEESRARPRKTKRHESQPVYGSGFVFYLDRAGRIRGIMCWGFPITEKGATELNQSLVNRMIEIINTNGGISRDRSDEDPLLKSVHLAEESKRLAELAIEGKRKGIHRRLTSKTREMPKPLHRYTAAKPPSVTSIGLLKRKDQSVFSELLGENIYIKADDIYKEAGTVRPPTLHYIYPMHKTRWHGEEEEDKRVDPYVLSQEDRIDQAWKDNERRARPAKEEPLWLRRGDALRGMNMAQMMNENFLFNMKRGRFADGSEPLQRAKVPKAVQEATDKFRDWAGRSDDEEQENVE